jgi:hypothetical protein
MSIENIKEKLKKLLSISKDDSASENEIESSLRIAARLMQSHHLSEDDLFESEEDQVSKIEKSNFKSVTTYVGGKKFKWETVLLSYVARLVGGIVIYTGHRELKKTPSGLLVNGGEKGVSFHFTGIAEDVEIAKQIFDELRWVIISLARMKHESVFKGEGAVYAEGFVNGLSSKLNVEQHKIANENNTDRGLILSKRRNELIKRKTELAYNFLEKNSVKLVKKGKLRGGTGTDKAFEDGLNDGKNYDVSVNKTRKLECY